MVDEIDISILMSKWDETRKQIAELETKLEKYKKVATKLMDKNGTNELKDNNFSLSRKNITRETLTKNDLPIDIWNRYSKRCTYQSFYLRNNKQNK